MRFLLVLFFFLGANSATADIIEDINNCEQIGGGTCVFDILRDLAGAGGGSTRVTVEFFGQSSNGNFRPK